MSFKYINPGYGELLDLFSAETVFNSAYNPKNGMSFHITNGTGTPRYSSGGSSSEVMSISLPPVDSTDIYVRFDLFADPEDSENIESNNFRLVVIIGDFLGGMHFNAQGVQAGTSGAGWHVTGYKAQVLGGDGYAQSGPRQLKIEGKPNNYSEEIKSRTLVPVYYKFNGAEKKATLIINDEVLIAFNKAVIIKPRTNVYVRMDWFSSKIYLSNLIVSDKYISPKEQVITLPANATETNLPESAAGIYIADAPEQEWFQSIETDPLIASYGESAAITGIAVIGNPAYKEKENRGVTSLVGMTKKGDDTFEHGVCYLPDSDYVNRIRQISWWEHGDTAIKELNTMQFGWQTRK